MSLIERLVSLSNPSQYCTWYAQQASGAQNERNFKAKRYMLACFGAGLDVGPLKAPHAHTWPQHTLLACDRRALAHWGHKAIIRAATTCCWQGEVYKMSLHTPKEHCFNRAGTAYDFMSAKACRHSLPSAIVCAALGLPGTCSNRRDPGIRRVIH